MKLLIQAVFILAFLLPLSVHAEIKTITHTVQQPFGGSQSPDDARTAGIARAKREALERFGTYIESRTVVKDAQVDSDEIMALTAGVTKAEVVKQNNYTDGDGFGLEITVKVELDTTVLDKSLKRLLQDRNHLKDLTDARQREKQLLARIVELETQNNQQGKSEKQKETLKKEFQKTRDGLTAVEWFDKATSLWDGKKFFAPYKAIEFLSYAIQLDPTRHQLYNNRGLAYTALQQQQQAIDDYTQAIKLYPAFSGAYNNRGIAYADLKKYQNAIQDYTKAIKTDPNYAVAYFNRGATYGELKEVYLAIQDYSQAIKLNPSFANAFLNQGNELARLRKFQQAIESYSKVILLQPNDAEAHKYRGNSYLQIGDELSGCEDLRKACLLNDCDWLKLAQQGGLCK